MGFNDLNFVATESSFWCACITERVAKLSAITIWLVQSTAQVQTLQQQMKVQLDLQSQQMQHMLTDQMTRIEAILAKKPRME